MGKETQKEVKEVRSIRFKEPRFISVPAKSIDKRIPKPIREYLERLAAEKNAKQQTDTATQ